MVLPSELGGGGGYLLTLLLLYYSWRWQGPWQGGGGQCVLAPPGWRPSGRDWGISCYAASLSPTLILYRY